MNSPPRFLFVICLLAACLTQFASDIYAPSIPDMALSLQTSITHVQWSMAIYLHGVAFSLLVYEFLSEGLGRKTPLLIGLSIFIVGSLIAWTAPNIGILLLGRLVQGCGAGASAGLWGSIFRDLFSGNLLAKYASLIAAFIMLSLSIAPILGGYLNTYLGWRSCFAFIAIYSLIILIAVKFFYQETSLYHHKKHLNWSFVRASYKELLSDSVFVAVTVCNFLAHGAYFSIFIVTPALFIREIGMSPSQYGLLIGIGSASAYILSSGINTRCVLRSGIKILMRFGWIIMVISGVLMWLLPFLFAADELWLAIPMILFFFGSTFIWPNAFSLALSPFPHIAAYASASYRLMLLAGGAVIGGVIAYLPVGTPIPLACVLTGCSILGWGIYEKFVVKVITPPPSR